MFEKESIKEYVAYLTAECRNKPDSLWQAHQKEIHREVARHYGLNEEEIKWLDENLVGGVDGDDN